MMAPRPGIKGDMEGLHYQKKTHQQGRCGLQMRIKEAERQGQKGHLYVEGNGGGREVWSCKPPTGRGVSTSEDVQKPVMSTAAGMRLAALLGFCRVKPLSMLCKVCDRLTTKRSPE